MSWAPTASSSGFQSYPPEVTSRYSLGRILGKGAFGKVFHGTVVGQPTNTVAIKYVEDVFISAMDARRALREISIMRQCAHPNIMGLMDIFAPPSPANFRDLWLVMGNGGYDLSSIIKNAHRLQGWSPLHVKYIMWQLLAALQYLHSANIAHRDLKPSNILVAEDNHLTLIDFGLARQLSSKKAPIKTVVGAALGSSLASPSKLLRKQTLHVVTRWYRAPELLLKDEQYSDAIDVWSTGCIYAELLKTLNPNAVGRVRPLFPGKTSVQSDPNRTKALPEDIMLLETSQLSSIFKVIGTPTPEECQIVKNPDLRAKLLTRASLPRLSFKDIFSYVGDAEVSIMNSTLQFDPRKRKRVAELLQIPYFDEVRDKNIEKLAHAGIQFPFEDVAMDKSARIEKDKVRVMIAKEIELFKLNRMQRISQESAAPSRQVSVQSNKDAQAPNSSGDGRDSVSATEISEFDDSLREKNDGLNTFGAAHGLTPITPIVQTAAGVQLPDAEHSFESTKRQRMGE